jgi:flagellar basal body rod protein FlgC
MTSQMARIGAISQNIANVEKLPDENGNVYKRQVVKQSGYNSNGHNFDQQLSIKMKKNKK